jgi:hypothetical protein
MARYSFIWKQEQTGWGSPTNGEPIQSVGVGKMPESLPGFLGKLLEELRGIEFVARTARIVRAQGDTVRFGKLVAREAGGLRLELIHGALVQAGAVHFALRRRSTGDQAEGCHANES